MMNSISTHWFVSWVVVAALGVLFIGCDDEDENERASFRRGGGPSVAAPSIEAREAAAKGGTGKVLKKNMDKATAVIREARIAETDFIESAKRRDPFRPFLEVILPPPDMRTSVQREIKLEEYDIEELKLIGIITNVGDPRAMVVPPNNIGFILRRGDYVGKPEFVDPGSGAKRIQLNWRVHRINGDGPKEERGMTLVRDDPLTSTPNDLTRFIPLYPQE